MQISLKIMFDKPRVMFLMCCHKPVSVSLYMCSSLYRTVSSLCFQFPKPCWHLEKRPHKPVWVKQPGLWDTRISRYAWCDRCVRLNWHSIHDGVLTVDILGAERGDAAVDTDWLTDCIQTGLVWKKSDMKLSHKLIFFLRSARMQSLPLKRKSNSFVSLVVLG